MAIDETPSAANIREAFAREAQAHMRCLYFARRADVEGRADVSAFLRALAEGEAGHSFGHLEFLEDLNDPLAGSGDTRGNLDSAIAEAEANATAYEDYAKVARRAKQADVADWFESVALAEHAHVSQLTRVRRTLDEEG